jgi:hypothetical protein
MAKPLPTLSQSLIAGLAGALAVNLVHEATRKAAGGNPPPARVPRLDRLGQEGLARGMRMVGMEPPAPGPKRYWAAMAGDVATNAALYAVATRSRNPLTRGVVAGTAGLVLPKLAGMQRHTGTTKRVKAMTFADYAIGGIVSGAVLKLLTRR